MKECDKQKSHISSKRHMTYISYNNVRHPLTKTFTPLHYTSPSYTSLHGVLMQAKQPKTLVANECYDVVIFT
jgi:hypothetical protein